MRISIKTQVPSDSGILKSNCAPNMSYRNAYIEIDQLMKTAQQSVPSTTS